MPPRHFLFKLFLVSFAVTAPLWYAVAFKWPVDTDLIFYSNIMRAFSGQLWSGELYPRWLMAVNDGLGNPVFLYYPPATFYILALIDWLSFADPHGLGRIVLGMQLAVFAGGLAARAWLMRTLPEAQATAGGLIYAGFPSLALIAYYDFGITQLWALACMPLLLIAAHRVAAMAWRGVPLLAALYALLALTHVPSTIVFGGVPVLYAAFLAAPGNRRRAFVLASLAALLGAALAMFYLLPAKLNQPFIMSGYFLGGNGDYTLNFWKVRNLVAVMFVALPLIGFFTELPRGTKRRLTDATVRFWLWIIALFAFMTSYLSYPLWKLLPILAYLQFPWRMMVGAMPAAVYICARWLPHVRSRTFFLWFSGLVLGINGYVSVQSLFFESSRPLGDSLNYSLVVSREYQTTWMAEQDIWTYTAIPDALHEMPQALLAEGRGKLAITAWEPRRIALSADIASKEARVDLRRFYFPGWQSGEYAAGPHKALLSLTLPKGKHEVALTLPWFNGEREGMLISLSALGFWLFLWLRSRRPRPITGA